MKLMKRAAVNNSLSGAPLRSTTKNHYKFFGRSITLFEHAAQLRFGNKPGKM